MGVEYCGEALAKARTIFDTPEHKMCKDVAM